MIEVKNLISDLDKYGISEMYVKKGTPLHQMLSEVLRDEMEAKYGTKHRVVYMWLKDADKPESKFTFEFFD